LSPSSRPVPTPEREPQPDARATDAPEVAPPTCGTVAERLTALERACGDPASAGHAQGLERHLAGCPPCTQRHGARLARLEGLCALRSRDVPAGMLDDLRARVLAGVREGGSGGMSAAFLDAPASLARWRRMAVAAGLLLAVGAGLVVSGRLELRAPAGTHDLDLRDALLPQLATGLKLDHDEDTLQPVLMPGQGVSGFYGPLEAPLPVGAGRRAPPPAETGE
jgi:hypothetical protein